MTRNPLRDPFDWFGKREAPLSRRRVAIVLGILIAGVALFLGPFALHMNSKAASAPTLIGGVVVLIGGVVVLGSYLVLWNDAVLRVARRLRATSIAEGRQEKLVLLCQLALGIISFAGLCIVIVTQGGH